MNKLLYTCLALVSLLLCSAAHAQEPVRAFGGRVAAPQAQKALSLTGVRRQADGGAVAFAGGSHAKARKSVPLKAGDGTTLYGEVAYSNLMNETTLSWGVYSFPAQANMTVTQKFLHTSICANGGGAYRKGKLHFTSYYEGVAGLSYLYFCTLDVNNWTLDTKALPADTYTSIGLDMTYDPVGDKLYMQAYTDDVANENVTQNTYTLSTMDIESGRSTPVAEMDRMSTIACDIAGQMYGVRYSDGMFCKIDKSNAHVTPIGSTGVNPMYNGSSTFDYKTGKLYWTTYERTTDKSGLYEIDLATGKASLISLFPNDEQITSLYIPQSDEIYSLNAPKLDVNFVGANTQGNVVVTAPTTNAQGAALSGNVTVSTYIDGRLTFTDEVKPGESASHTLTLAQGNHTAEAVASQPGVGKSERKQVKFYVGTDGPAAVRNLTLSKTGDYTAHLTWEQPTEGEHGSTINPNLVYYEVYRQPGNVLLSDGTTGTEYTDHITSKQLRNYSYTLVGYYKGVKGASATSNEVAFGEPSEIPYAETFDSQSAFDTYLTINANGDKGVWQWNSDKKCAAYSYDTFNKADDWLITPGLRMSAGRSYKLKFQAASTSWMYPEALEVKLGNGTNVENFTTTLIPETKLVHQDLREYEAVVTVPADGNYFVGFHALSDRGLYELYVDDVRVEFGPATTAPDTVRNARATQEANGGKAITVSFTAPTLDFSGNALGSLTAVNVYRNSALVKEFANPAVGAELSFTDATPATGRNTYRIVAVNASGESNPVEVTGWSGADEPTAPLNVKLTSTDGKTAVLTWSAPQYGANGGTIDASKLTYNVYNSKNVKVASAISATTFTDATIDTVGGQVNAYYYVAALSDNGNSELARSNIYNFGRPYQDGFSESFAGGKFNTQAWIAEVINPSPFSNAFYGRYWGFTHDKWDRGPRPAAQDGDGGYLIAYTDYIDVESRMISPKINVKGLKNPVLSFWFYQYYNPDTENGYSHYNETMTAQVLVDGKYTDVTKPIHLINGNGWYRYDVLLKDYVGASDFQVAFKTHNYLSYDMHIDNITIKDVKDNDLAVTQISAPEKIAVGSERQVTATVFNGGATTASGYKVQLLRNGEVAATQEGADAHAFGAEKTYSFTIAPTIADAGKTYTYAVRVVADADDDPTNNVSSEVKVEIPANDVPAVTDLNAQATAGWVKLSWSEPDDSQASTATTEGFETYEAFTIKNFGNWTLYDGDQGATYDIKNSNSESGSYDYPNAGSPMAFQVFNPTKAGIASQLWQPYLGNQMAVCFDAAGSQNSDWLISPEVKGGTKVSLMARSVTSLYGLERFEFAYSTESTDSATFKTIGNVNVVPAKWTKYEFTLPADAKYFAIHCVSADVYALLVDEIQYEGANPAPLQLQGFNVYRDGNKLNTAAVEESAYTDAAVEEGKTYSYNVTALYDRGESAYSNTVQVLCSGVNSLDADLPTVWAASGAIHVRNAQGRPVAVYNVAGQQLYNSSGEARHDVAVPGGVYLVKVGATAVKVLVK